LKYGEIFGGFPELISGNFLAGTLNGEAKVQLHGTKEVFFVNFVDGVPHGRIRSAARTLGSNYLNCSGKVWVT
jgi:hypothetical protein